MFPGSKAMAPLGFALVLLWFQPCETVSLRPQFSGRTQTESMSFLHASDLAFEGAAQPRRKQHSIRSLLSDESAGGRNLSDSQPGPADAETPSHIGSVKYLLIVCFAGVGGIILLVGCLWYAWVNHEQHADEYKLHVDKKIAELRDKLHMTRKHGFILSTERKGYLHSHTMLERRSMEAVAQFFLFESFDVCQFDSFSTFLLQMQQDVEVVRDEDTKCSMSPHDRYETLVSMVVDTCRQLLLPNLPLLDSEGSEHLHFIPRQSIGSNAPVAPSPAGEHTWPGSPKSHLHHRRDSLRLHVVGAAQGLDSESTAQERFAFLAGRVKDLTVWKDLNGKNFVRLQAVAQELMDEMHLRCDARFHRLVTEPQGAALASLVWEDGDALPSRVSSGVRWLQGAPRAAQPAAEGTSGSVFPSLDLSTSSDRSLATTRAGSAASPPTLSVTINAKPSALSTLSFPGEAGGSPGGEVSNLAWSAALDLRRHSMSSRFRECLHSSLSCEAASAPTIKPEGPQSAEDKPRRALSRQDDDEVRAIRMDSEGRQEYMLQVYRQRCTRQLLALHRGPSSASNAACVGSIALMEEVFLSQLHSRACLLNAEFQHRVEEVIRAHRHPDHPHAVHCVSDDLLTLGLETDARRTPSIRSEGPRRRQSFTAESATGGGVGGHEHESDEPMGSTASQCWMCVFDHEASDDGPTTRPVMVQQAQVKTKHRMRAKLRQYADGNLDIPFSANILDPVRASIVCSSPADLLAVYGWFLDHEEETGLRICRVKNKFLLADASEFDGYRDLMLCVVFRGESGLGIIGEIQLHDRQLFDLKSKMHKLYKVKRAKKASDI